MSARDLVANALGHVLSAGDAPGNGPGPFETLLGLPGMPGPLKQLGRGADNPDRKPSDEDAIEMIGDFAPMPTGPYGKAAEVTFKVGRHYNKTQHDRIKANDRAAKGLPAEGE